MPKTIYRLLRFSGRANVLALLICAGLLVPSAGRANFADPIDTPAATSLTPASEALLSLAQAGLHIVAAGPRGMVIYGDESGAGHWVQAKVPVQSDLVSVQFVDARNGWACGHDGVILHTADGGLTWVKQLDGVRARSVFESYYQQQIAAGDKALSADLQQVQLNYDPGPSLPWLGVWFQNLNLGYAVGSFGDIAMTADGGKTWQPWLEHIDNPNFLDLNAIRNVGGTLYVVGEQGSVYAFDPAQNRFVVKSTGYDGMLFGLTGSAQSVIVFGLAGTVYRSDDQGKSWTKSLNPSDSSIMDGTVLADGRVVLVTVDGGILVSDDDGKTFKLSAQTMNSPLSSVLPAGNGVVLTSLGGIRNAAP